MGPARGGHGVLGPWEGIPQGSWTPRPGGGREADALGSPRELRLLVDGDPPGLSHLSSGLRGWDCPPCGGSSLIPLVVAGSKRVPSTWHIGPVPGTGDLESRLHWRWPPEGPGWWAWARPRAPESIFSTTAPHCPSRALHRPTGGEQAQGPGHRERWKSHPAPQRPVRAADPGPGLLEVREQKLPVFISGSSCGQP